MTDDKPTFINIEPDWPNTLHYFAVAMRDHSFQRGAKLPVISLIEMVRYLAVTDPDELARVIEDLSK